MAQNTVDFGIDPSGVELLDDLLDPLQENILTQHSGVSRPSYAQSGTLWLDTVSTPWVLKMFNGTADIIIGEADPSGLIFTPSDAVTESADNTFTGENVFQDVIDVTNINAETSSGGNLRNASGQTCASWGTGGGTTVTLNASLLITATSSSPSFITLREDTDNGTNGVSIIAPTTLSADRTLTLPDASGTVALTSDISSITEGTEQSGTGTETFFDFTGIPSGTKRITISFYELELSGTDDVLVQLGDSGGLETTGYISTSLTNRNATTPVSASSTSGFVIEGDNPTGLSGHMVLTRVDSGGTKWVSSHTCKSRTTSASEGGGTKTLSGELTQLRITRTGTDTVSSGSVNILYEG